MFLSPLLLSRTTNSKVSEATLQGPLHNTPKPDQEISTEPFSRPRFVLKVIQLPVLTHCLVNDGMRDPRNVSFDSFDSYHLTWGILRRALKQEGGGSGGQGLLRLSMTFSVKTPSGFPHDRSMGQLSINCSVRLTNRTIFALAKNLDINPGTQPSSAPIVTRR